MDRNCSTQTRHVTPTPLRVLNLFFQGGNAIIALIFAEYLNRIFWHATSAEASPDSIPDWAIKLTATIAVLIVTGLVVGAKRLGSRAAVIITIIKVSCCVSCSLKSK